MRLPNSESDVIAMALAVLVNRSSAYLAKVGAAHRYLEAEPYFKFYVRSASYIIGG